VLHLAGFNPSAEYSLQLLTQTLVYLASAVIDIASCKEQPIRALGGQTAPAECVTTQNDGYL
jgi:hypothetical protein